MFDEYVCFLCVIQFRMTEFGTLEIVTDLEVKGQQAAPNSETLDPAQSHTPTPPPEGQSQTSKAAAPANQSQSGSSQAKGMRAPLKSLQQCYCEELHCLCFYVL